MLYFKSNAIPTYGRCDINGCPAVQGKLDIHLGKYIFPVNCLLATSFPGLDIWYSTQYTLCQAVGKWISSPAMHNFCGNYPVGKSSEIF